MNGYILFRKDGETAVVIKCENDDELLYLLRKLERTRVRWLRSFARKLLVDYFEKSNMVEEVPPVHVVQSDFHNLDNKRIPK